jgi:hypothetical protein
MELFKGYGMLLIVAIGLLPIMSYVIYYINIVKNEKKAKRVAKRLLRIKSREKISESIDIEREQPKKAVIAPNPRREEEEITQDVIQDAIQRELANISNYSLESYSRDFREILKYYLARKKRRARMALEQLEGKDLEEFDRLVKEAQASKKSKE